MSVPLFAERRVRLGALEAVLAVIAVAVASVLLRSRPEQIARVLARSGVNRPSAGPELALRAREAVCTVSARCRGPKGCVRRSIATVVLCRLRGTTALWCTGFALEPFRAHAWVVVDGCPVGEPDEVAGFATVLSSAPTRDEE